MGVIIQHLHGRRAVRGANGESEDLKMCRIVRGLSETYRPLLNKGNRPLTPVVNGLFLCEAKTQCLRIAEGPQFVEFYSVDSNCEQLFLLACWRLKFWGMENHLSQNEPRRLC